LVVGLQLTTSTYKVEEIQKQVRDYWNRYVKGDGSSMKGGVALYGEAKFKGNCRKCGKYGHKAADCRGGPGPNGNDGRTQINPGPGKSNKDRECSKCKKKGHYARECRGGAPKQENRTAVESMFVGIHHAGDLCGECAAAANSTKTKRESRWLIDSGASVHICKDRDLLKDVKNVSETVVIGDGTEVVATLSGTVNLITTEKGKQLSLSNVLYAPEFTKNIISVARLTLNGNTVSFDDRSMIISNGTNQLTCKRDLRSGPGGMFYITGVVWKQLSYDVSSKTVESSKPERGEKTAKIVVPGKSNERGRNTIKVDINKAHKLLGHVGLKSLKETAKLYDWDLLGKLEVCVGCIEAKAKAKPIAKTTITKACCPGERLFIDRHQRALRQIRNWQ
jgi:hypothetical protein